MKEHLNHSHSFFTFFPAPKFLEMPAPGLSISDSGIHMVEFVRHKDGYHVEKFGKLFFEGSRIREGEVQDKKGLINDLTTFRKEHSLHYVRASLPEERAYLFSTEVVGKPDSNLRGAVESIIEENVPLTVTEAVFDYSVISSHEKEGKTMTKVSVSAIPQNVVEEYLDVFRAAGLEPLHFDIESQAVAKAVIPRGESAVNIIVNVMKNKVGIYIDDGGAITFASTSALSSWSAPGESVGESVAVSEIISELKKVFLYWQTQSDKHGGIFRPVNHIYLVGDMAVESRLEDLLAKKFDIKTGVGNVWNNILDFSRYVPPISKEESLEYAASAGLALPKNIL
jgi:Tfp pilus assembly PilM family ATPase